MVEERNYVTDMSEKYRLMSPSLITILINCKGSRKKVIFLVDRPLRP